MEASCIFCRGISTLTLTPLKSRPSFCWRRNEFIFPAPSSTLASIYLFDGNNLVLCHPLSFAFRFSHYSPTRCRRSTTFSATNTKRSGSRRKNRGPDADGAGGKSSVGPTTEIATVLTAGSFAPADGDRVRRQGRWKQQETCSPASVRALSQNGDPLGRRDLGKSVVKWICQGMKAMASDFIMAEMQGEFAELRQLMGPGLTFVIQAQPYLNAVPMPLGLEAICLKVCTHYPTLLDHFQRELRDLLQGLQRKSLVLDWRQTESWQLLKELANSGFRSLSSRSFPFFFFLCFFISFRCLPVLLVVWVLPGDNDRVEVQFRLLPFCLILTLSLVCSSA